MIETLERVSELTTSLANSELGQELARRPRFRVFKPDSMTAEDWEQLLDSDVNNFRHNPLTAGLGYVICLNEVASDEAAKKVVITSAIHDIPEVYTGDAGGDMPLGLSTETDEKEEHSFLTRLGDDPVCAISPNEAALAETVMLDSKNNKETEEGGLFWLTEKLGYFRTAFIAYDVYRHLPDTSGNTELRAHLLYMWSDIFGNSYEDLVNEIGNFKSIRDVFEDRYADLEAMYALTMGSLFELKAFYGTAEVGGRKFVPQNEILKIVNGYGAHVYMEQLINSWQLNPTV